MVTKVESAIEPVDTVYEPIRHVVKKERPYTVYPGNITYRLMSFMPNIRIPNTV